MLASSTSVCVHFLAPMLPPEVVCPWSPPELPEVSWVSSLEQELSYLLCGQHLGLASAANHRFQMEDYSEHDKVTVIPQFGDADLKEWLAGVSSPSPLPEMNNHPLEDKSYYVIGVAASKETNSDYDIKNFLKRSIPKSLFKMQGAWGRLGLRKCRMRSTSWRNELTKFGANPSMLEHPIIGVKFGTRRNNVRWTFEEMCKLVEAVSKHGVGKWTTMKRDYFKTSIREKGHLKDKWRDLLRACGLKVGLKNKVEAHKDTRRIVEQFKDKIINIYWEKQKKRRASQR